MIFQFSSLYLQFTWVRASFFTDNLEIKHTKNSDCWDCGTKYGISLHKTIKMVKITQHKQDICICSILYSILLVGDQHLQICVRRWEDEGTLQTSSLRSGAALERRLWQTKCRSWSQLAHGHDSHVQATGCHSPSCPKVPLSEAWDTPCAISNHSQHPLGSQKLPNKRSHPCGMMF